MKNAAFNQGSLYTVSYDEDKQGTIVICKYMINGIEYEGSSENQAYIEMKYQKGMHYIVEVAKGDHSFGGILFNYPIENDSILPPPTDGWDYNPLD